MNIRFEFTIWGLCHLEDDEVPNVGVYNQDNSYIPLFYESRGDGTDSCGSYSFQPFNSATNSWMYAGGQPQCFDNQNNLACYKSVSVYGSIASSRFRLIFGVRSDSDWKLSDNDEGWAASDITLYMPTPNPTGSPFKSPTGPPTKSPTVSPSQPPTRSPSLSPSKPPSNSPTLPPTASPSRSPSKSPTRSPSGAPSRSPSNSPSSSPSRAPSNAPTQPPTAVPTVAPTNLASAKYEVFYNHTGLDYYFLNLEEYMDVMSEAVTEAFQQTLLNRTKWIFVNDNERSKLNSSNLTAKEQQSLVAQLWKVSVCAVFSLDIRCSDDESEDEYNEAGSSKSNGGAVYKSQGMVFYSGDDTRLAIDYSNELLPVLFESPDPLELFFFIEASMNERYPQGSFSVGGMTLATLSYGSEAQVQDYFEETALALAVFVYAFMLVCFVLAGLAYIHAQTYGADNVRVLGIVYFALYTYDFFSDVVFAARLGQQQTWFLLVPALVFLIIPYVLNIVQYYREQERWLSDARIQERVRGYLIDWSWHLMLLSIISGSTFAAIELANCNAFGYDFFCFGLTERHLKQYSSNRLYSTLLFENFPQLVLQFIFMFVVRKSFDQYAFYATLSSVLSVLMAAMDSYSAKQLLKNMKDIARSKGGATATFDVELVPHRRDEIGELVTNLDLLMMRPNALRKALATVLQTDHRLIEINVMIKQSEGLHFGFTVFDKRQNPEQLTKSLILACNDGSLAYTLQQNWQLSREVQIDRVSLMDDLDMFQVLWPPSKTKINNLKAISHFSEQFRTELEHMDGDGTGKQLIQDTAAQELAFGEDEDHELNLYVAVGQSVGDTAAKMVEAGMQGVIQHSTDNEESSVVSDEAEPELVPISDALGSRTMGEVKKKEAPSEEELDEFFMSREELERKQSGDAADDPALLNETDLLAVAMGKEELFWLCPHCSAENASEDLACFGCGQSKPDRFLPSAAAGLDFAPAPIERVVSASLSEPMSDADAQEWTAVLAVADAPSAALFWVCPQCASENGSDEDSCFNCAYQKTDLERVSSQTHLL